MSLLAMAVLRAIRVSRAGWHRMPRQCAIGLRDAAARPVCLKTGAVLAAVKNAARRYAMACGHS